MTTPERLSSIRREAELASLRAAEDALAGAEEKMTAAVSDRFRLQLGECRRQLEKASDWRALREVADTTVRPVVDEVFAYVQAVLYRRAGLDGGVGAIAQRLADDIAGRAGIDRAVLIAFGGTERITHTFSMIRMRFQDTTVWRLPVIAHEVGHHVAQYLRDVDFAAFAKFPALKLLADKADTTADHARLHELFADVFATYALGAAYPLCAIVTEAGLDQAPASATHPSWPVRVSTMIAALHAMGPAFALKADRLVTPLWSALSQRPEPAPVAADLVEVLARHTPPRLRFDIDGPAHRLYTDIATRDAGEPPPGTTIPLVLEAAWRWRVANLAARAGQLATVNENAKRWCSATLW